VSTGHAWYARVRDGGIEALVSYASVTSPPSKCSPLIAEFEDKPHVGLGLGRELGGGAPERDDVRVSEAYLVCGLWFMVVVEGLKSPCILRSAIALYLSAFPAPSLATSRLLHHPRHLDGTLTLARSPRVS